MCVALKNTFKILDQKLFHPFSTEVKFTFACSIVHNLILWYGIDEFVSDGANVLVDDHDRGHGVKAHDNKARKSNRL
jgi:hypothetical protein